MRKKDICCDLKTCILCRDCLPDWVPAISNHKQNLFVKKGGKVFEEGNEMQGIFFIFRGKIKVHKKWGAEKELIVRFAKEGDMIGYRGLGNERIYPVSATALEDTILCFVSMEFFDTTLKVNHQLTYDLMQFYAEELQEAERRMRNLAHMDVKGRIAEAFLTLQKVFGQHKDGSINIQLTKQDIASYCGTTYETLSRTITEMIKEKLIKVTGKAITISKQRKLEELTINK